jgi:hypothetical protein
VDDPAQCKTCHTLDANGAPRAPAAQGHAPCMRSGCHASDFMVISENGKKFKPQEFARASAFCTGCHPTVPWAWKKPATLTIQAWRNQREHHIEMAKEGDPPRGMDHFGHTQMKKKDGTQVACRDCHIVDNEFKLKTGTPGHAQCMQCHGPSGTGFKMEECGRCHKAGGREGWLRGVLERAKIKVNEEDIHGSRPKTSVRSCESAGAASADKQFKGKNPKAKCFKHETPSHRLTNDKKDVQCQQCHHMIGDSANWAGKSFSSIADLHTNKIIGTGGAEKATGSTKCPPDKNDAQHAACSGGSACHRHKEEVNLSCPVGQRNCALCHAQRTNNEAF